MRTPAEYCGASSGGILEHELNLLINESHGHISNKCVLDVPALSRAVETGGTAQHFSRCLDSGWICLEHFGSAVSAVNADRRGQIWSNLRGQGLGIRLAALGCSQRQQTD